MSPMSLCMCTYLWGSGVPFIASLQQSALQSHIFWKRLVFKCCRGFSPYLCNSWDSFWTRWLACTKDRAETEPPRAGRHTYIACGFSIQLLSNGLAFSALAPLPKKDCHTAGSTYCTCGKVCDSLVGTVCFSPVLVMFLLGCGKNISRGWRDNGGMWLVKGWPQPIIS